MQHADNPVEWYPWGDEALGLAKKTGKPIFLSIGYATCHWCHVMAHESFENPEIAALMNEHFINIKVDREERPDLDAIYMLAVQAISGSGGWPMSVWLTPDLKPFYGGTYFPPEDRYGRSGFPAVLNEIASIYATQRDRVESSSNEIASLLESSMAARVSAKKDLPSVTAVRSAAFESLKAMFDSVNGGFGGAPKFPMPVYLEFLVRTHARTGDPKALEMATFTMRKMIAGGLYDQLAGGFARYSTDDKWLVPHFEKMLYDNSQLLSVLARLYAVTSDPLFLNVADQTIDYLTRHMMHPEKKAFFSARDADSEGKEGAYYVWTVDEIKKALGADAELLLYYYGVTSQGNFVDPHSDEIGRNVLTQARTTAETAQRFGANQSEIESRIEKARLQLESIRNKRPAPSLDDKVITEWNGMMMSALAILARATRNNSYLEKATAIARFLEADLYDSKTKTLFRSWRNGERHIDAHQIDYAMLIQGLLDLFEAGWDPYWLEWAIELQTRHNTLFFDAGNGGYFMTGPRADLIFRMKDDSDNVIASGNSIAVSNGFRLASLTARDDFHQPALRTLKFFSSALMDRAVSLPTMVSAYDFDSDHRHIVIAGSRQMAGARELLKISDQPFDPNLVQILLDSENDSKLEVLMPFVAGMKPMDGKPAAYLCSNRVCRRPVADAAELARQLKDRPVPV